MNIVCSANRESYNYAYYPCKQHSVKSEFGQRKNEIETAILFLFCYEALLDSIMFWLYQIEMFLPNFFSFVLLNRYFTMQLDAQVDAYIWYLDASVEKCLNAISAAI